MIPYQLIRSKRRSISLIVGPGDQVTVRAPLHLKQAAIDAFVQEKTPWVRQQQAELARQAELCGRPPGQARRFEPGEKLLFLGQEISLEWAPRQTQLASLEDGRLLLSKSAQPRASQVCEAWYKTQARAFFNSRTAELARLHGFTYQTLRLSSARTRWGSCSSRGVISLTWRLVMAPAEIIDYVILHELAHLKERNHSPRFWALLGRLDPAYRLHRQWLKEHGACLAWPS